MEHFEFTIRYTEMRDKFIQAYHGQSPLGLNRSNYSELKADWNRQASWYGASAVDTIRYLQDGFVIPGLQGIDTSVIPARKRQKPRFNDCEGEFRYDLFESGDDNYFVDWTKREIQPAITVEFGSGFRGGTPAKVISDYSRWVCQALIAIEQSGIDSSVFATIKGAGRFADGNRLAEKQTIRIEVKREGERGDLLQWSRLLSPASYRHLGFFTILLMGDHFNRKVSGGIGGSSGEGWNVKWNSEKKSLEITHKAETREDFPERMMTEKLISALAEARG